MTRQQAHLAEQMNLYAAVGDGVEEMAAGAALGDDSLQKFFAAYAGNVDRWIFGLLIELTWVLHGVLAAVLRTST